MWESVISGLFRPELRDAHPVIHPNIILFDFKLTKRISMCNEIYINLQKQRKVSTYAGLWVVVTLKRVMSLIAKANDLFVNDLLQMFYRLVGGNLYCE